MDAKLVERVLRAMHEKNDQDAETAELEPHDELLRGCHDPATWAKFEAVAA